MNSCNLSSFFLDQKMESFWVFFCFLFSVIIFPVSMGQLTPTEGRILLQVQQLLEYPEALQGWNNWTSFCYLPHSPSLKIVCTDNRVTELTIIGNKSSPSVSGDLKVSQQTLSEKFSIDAFFTVLTKLSHVKVLSLVSLGMWGHLPPKVNRFQALEVLNISSNFIYGELPRTISTFVSLRSIVLADNLLNGSVPDLRSLLLLEELNLGDNRFGPEFPSLGTSLVSVVLKNNSLRSVIPLGLMNFDRLQQFDISSNKFVGPIPSSIFYLPSIQYLNLAKNQFTGAFQTNISCSGNLRFVDISHNHLIGKLPSCVGSNSSNLTVISSWNCLSGGNLGYQLPNSVCRKEALAVKPPTRNDAQKSSSKLGLILGVVAGIVGVLVVLGLLTLAIFRKSRPNKSETDIFNQGSVAYKSPLHSSSKPISEARHVPTTMGFGTLGLPPYHVFTLEEMEDATNNFDPSNLIAEGSQGQSYKGWLRDGSEVLVKCLKLKHKHSPQSLPQQMEAVTKLRHQHLVSVLGHCIVTYQEHPNTASTVFIVVEHVANGSLRDHLTDRRRREILKWPQRLGISIGIARGIQFLHTGNAPGIFGNNLKIENVLLNEKLTTKISNYNIPLRFKVGSESPLNGPKFRSDLQGAQEAERDDIYQLGVILLEIITGKQVTSESELNELKLQLERGLTESASKLRALTDPSIRGTFAYESLTNTVQITLNCLSKDSRKRPSIADVLWNLQYSIQVQEGWASSEGLSTQP